MGFFRSSLRLPVGLAGIVVATLLAAPARDAQAQTVSISTSGIGRLAALRTDPTGRFKVSRSDCLSDDVINFPLIVGSYAGSTLEVWATQSTSDDCRTDTARTTASATCWRIFSATPNSTTLTISIRVQDFAARPATLDGVDAGTAAACASTTSTGQPVTLWFMFLQGTSQVGTAQSWSTTVDLLGPAPPSVNELGAGSGLLKLSWAANTDPDVVAYKFFCEPLGSTSTGTVNTYEAGATGPDGGGTGGTCPDAGGGDDASTSDDAGDASDEAGGATNDASCTPGTGGGSTGGTTGCGSVLVAGRTLSPDQIAQFACGNSNGPRSESSLITNLKNYERYAVAMSSSDLVENVGTLSTVQCATPEPVNGFDEAYRSAGGRAGGASFCSLGLRSARARATLWPGVAFVGVVAFGRWRRRARRARQA